MKKRRQFTQEIEVRPVHNKYCYDPTSKRFIPKHCNCLINLEYDSYCRAFNTFTNVRTDECLERTGDPIPEIEPVGRDPFGANKVAEAVNYFKQHGEVTSRAIEIEAQLAGYTEDRIEQIVKLAIEWRRDDGSFGHGMVERLHKLIYGE